MSAEKPRSDGDVDRVLPARYPLAPLDRYLESRGISKEELGRRGWKPSGQVRRRGTVAWDVADRVAVLLGVHPSRIWPDWFDYCAATEAHGERVG